MPVIVKIDVWRPAAPQALQLLYTLHVYRCKNGARGGGGGAIILWHAAVYM